MKKYGQAASLIYLLFAFALLDLQAQSLPEDSLRAEEGYPQPELSEEDYAKIQTPVPYTPAPIPPVALRPIQQKDWEKAIGDIDYSKDQPEKPKPGKPENSSGINALDWTKASNELGTILQAIAVILALIAIAYGVYRMLQVPSNKRVASDGVEITLNNLDEYLHESDLDRFLREALAAQQYGLAVRLYFLQIIKQLSERKNIIWAREKTNRDYVREMQGHHLGESFRALTRSYERVWYGNETLSSTDFNQLEDQFKSFMNRT